MIMWALVVAKNAMAEAERIVLNEGMVMIEVACLRSGRKTMEVLAVQTVHL